ncbi:MAG: isocitrate/isopropylmalate family dehydrogenase [Alphaproteobacteria bacterium]
MTRLLVLDGDGIGPEIVAAGVGALEALDARFGLGLELETAVVGLAGLARDGVTITDEVLDRARAVDGVILGPASVSDYPPPEEGGLNVSAAFRKGLELYANIRPSYTREGVPAMASEMDLVVARENLEGFYADRSMVQGQGEFMPSKDMALVVGKITTEGTTRIARAAFELARRRRKRVTIVHKANALRIFYGHFVATVEAVAGEYPDIEVDDVIIDAMAALLIRTPERFDVVVTTNMFGDILSDEAAELAGGLGLAASLNHGDAHAVAQAGHGSAPDIAGRDVANPTALMHSIAMLLDHLGAERQDNALSEAGATLIGAIDGLLARPETRTADLGGGLGTGAFGAAVARRIAEEAKV